VPGAVGPHDDQVPHRSAERGPPPRPQPLEEGPATVHRADRELPQQRPDARRGLHFGEVDRQLDLTASMLPRHLPERLEHVDRIRVVREHRRLEAPDPLLLRTLDERVEQPAPGAPTLPVVHHHDRRLGHVRPGAHLTRHADALAPLLP
jgi:hypothetical protein